jgi:hypothetical protein
MQLPENSAAAREPGETILAALGRNLLFISYFRRCSTGIRGSNRSAHVDNAMRQNTASGKSQRIRRRRAGGGRHLRVARRLNCPPGK